MKRLKFKCKFLSDVILNAQTATEGTQETLDYIPGSNFLGVVASKYSEFGSDLAYSIFHSGKVCFGDAHLSTASEKSFKAPLSWFINKGDKISDTKWIHHTLTPALRDKLVEKSKQVKQVRSGWLTNDGQQLKVENNFAIKSAYDRETRTSADGQLFGYRSLQSGTEWIFYVDIEESINPESITDKLVGEKSIGRSRSAQFGRVNISLLAEEQVEPITVKTFKLDGRSENFVAVYAESRLAFFDDYGQPTLLPTAAQLGFAGWDVEWDLSQTKSQVFAPWNGVVGGRLSDRICFEKGSVFILSTPSVSDIVNVESVGEFRSEGFGQVIINPNFLEFDSTSAEASFKVTEDNGTTKTFPVVAVQKSDQSDNLILSWLNTVTTEQKQEVAIYKAVKDFTENNKGKFRASASQWGQIRERAAQANSVDKLIKTLFADIVPHRKDGTARSGERAASGFLMHGKMEKVWKNSFETLKTELENNKQFGTMYAERLAAQMQKVAKKNKKKGGNHE